MFDFSSLIGRRNEFDRFYRTCIDRFSGDSNLLDELSREYGMILRIIDAAKKRGTTLEKAAELTGTSTDSIRRWNKGSLPNHFSYAMRRRIDLTKLAKMENFLFLLGIYQSHIKYGIPTTTFDISTKDHILEPTLEDCFKDCFEEEAIAKKEQRNGFNRFIVNSKPLMALIKDLTNDNTSVPLALLKNRKQARNLLRRLPNKY